MLKQRVLTAIVLLLLVSGALAWGQGAFALLGVVCVAIGIYEWLRLAGYPPGALTVAVTALGGAVLWGLDHMGLSLGVQRTLAGCALLVWMVVLVGLVRVQRGDAVPLGRVTSTWMCVVLMSAAWFALMSLSRAGALTLVSALAVVWVADIAAYFAGRAWGKRKLASLISPGKTWAGVVGAWVLVTGLALGAAYLWPTTALFTTTLIQRLGWVSAAALLAVLVMLSIVGDLFESLLKRRAGVKDSGTVLPGHGGVLDRIDALLPVLPALLWVRDLGGL